MSYRKAAALCFIFIAIITSQALPSFTKAQTPTPTTPIPIAPITDPNVQSLQATIVAQQVEIEALRRDLNYEVRDIRWWFIVAGIIAALMGISGFRAWFSIDEQVRKRIRILTNKYFYQLDVTNVIFHVQNGQHQQILIDLLKSQGIYRIRLFELLDIYSLTGITIYYIENKEDEQDFISYIRRYYQDQKRLNPERAAFLLYVPSKNVRVEPETIEMFPSTAIANTPWSLISMILVLGRHITPPPTFEQEDKDKDT